MSMTTFEAGTQYGDWKGTAAADCYGGGTNSIDMLFEKTGKVDKENELLVGFEFYAAEGYFFLQGFYHPKSQNTDIGGWTPTLNADFQNDRQPIEVKQVKVEVSREEFFTYFKRFNVVLLRRGLDIVGRDYQVVEEV